jgi:hypothetical protein
MCEKYHAELLCIAFLSMCEKSLIMHSFTIASWMCEKHYAELLCIAFLSICENH